MIYDCFSFYNEFDLLELRLATLYDHVDAFIISEGTCTYSGKDKPFYYHEAKEKCGKYWDKVHYVEAQLDRSCGNRMRERLQKDALKQQLQLMNNIYPDLPPKNDNII